MKPDPTPGNHFPARARLREGFTVHDFRFRGRGPFSFQLAPGACVGLTGPSGIGKSLLLRALADLDPHGGALFLDGRPSASFTGPQWRRRVGYLSATSQWWHETVADHFQGDWTALLAPSGLPRDIGRKPVNRLSTGERQRLAILRLLGNHPRVLLLDEPTANLDRENALRMERLLLADLKARKAAALWVSHDLALLDRVAGYRFVWRETVLEEIQTGSARPA